MSNPKLTEILETLEFNKGVYEREAVDAAIEHKDEIIPYLIDILKNVLADPQRYIDQFDYIAHIYAFILLGHFKETEAHQVIVDLFNLPEKLIDPLFGDLITEDLATVLFRTCGGSVEQIKALITNRDAFEYCRGSASGALTYAVAEGFISRESALDFLGSLFTGDEDTDSSSFWSLIISDMCDLYPAEKMDVIEQAFQDNLIDGFLIGPDSFEEVLTGTKEEALARLRNNMSIRSLDDVHKQMSWWAMFKPDNRPTPPPSLPGETPTGWLPAQSTNRQMTQKPANIPSSKNVSQKKKQAKKKKRKMANTSRKQQKNKKKRRR